jgi:hypothetical protein
VPLGMPVRITEATLPLPVAPAVSVSAVALPLADPPSFSPPAEPVPSAPASSGDDDSNGFFTGAVRKTRDSIVHTGVVTGSSIAGAFRGVFGMFKKVNPF